MDAEKKVVTSELVLHTAWEVGVEVPDAEAKEEIRKLITEYLTSRQGVFFGDYGVNAWGGWSGPTLVKSDVRKPGE